MKHTLSTKFRRVLALTLMLLMIASLGGCWKKDDSDSTEPESTAASTHAPIETTTEAPTTVPTDPSTEATTEAPTEEPTEAPTEPKLDGIKATVTAPSLKIRKGAGSEYQSIGTYSKGDQIELLEVSGNWGRTNKGWVSMDYVQVSGTTKPNENQEEDKTTTSSEVVSDGKTTALGYGVVNLGTLNVRSGPGTKYDDIGNVTLGSRYAYYQKSGNWVRIKDGWISLSYFYVEGNTGDGAGTGTTTSDLNIRSGPSKNFDRVGSYKSGETVKILTQINKWGYTGKGWISMTYVKMDASSPATGGKGTVTASELNIRKEASADSEKVGVYTNGTKIEILEVKGDWGRTDKGWVSMTYVKMDSTTTTTTPTYTTGTGTVTASSLYIRKKADKTSDTVGAYFKDDKVTILEVSGKWGRTDKGWISLDYVKMDAGQAKSVEPAQTATGTVTASSLYIRKEPTTSSTAIDAYSNGTKVEILETKDGWGRTDKGWIYLDYVKLDK